MIRADLSLKRARDIAARHQAVLGEKPLYAKKADDKRGKLYIYDFIGESWWDEDSGVSAKKVRDALKELEGVAALDIYINSEGGDIFEAKAIHSQLRRFEGEKVVHIDGLAASAATFIAMVGDKIITAPAATWMIHEVRALAMGTAEDMRAMADLLELENKAFAETYAKRTKNEVDDILDWMAAETWMSAQEAKKRGFTDEIAEEVEEETEAKAAVSGRGYPLAAVAARTHELTRQARHGQRLQALNNRQPRRA